ncbi:hypothetical protein [Bauldia litoralis]|uniref:Uncharacterized protein n=1 Tax=Bauldia litoralis TaxID=665467 RepID=A0A1G6CQP3_9HYPH|nr:hypothetical protein [Bauldia litoralis]SDB35209.1 hypothetical protein SAMN02982931_02621 [Bauldia litoralis]
MTDANAGSEKFEEGKSSGPNVEAAPKPESEIVEDSAKGDLAGTSGTGETPLEDRDPAFTLRVGAFAAGAVVVCSVGFVAGMLWLLYFQLDRIETSARVTPVEAVIGALTTLPIVDERKVELLGQLVMESDAQFLRSERSQSLVAARLTVMIIAELIGLSLVVLGGAFIFARIRGAGSLDLSKGTEVTGKLLSEFPGLFLCGFGAFVVIWALNTSVDRNSIIRTMDRPLFFPSPYEDFGQRPHDAPEEVKDAANLGDKACLKHAPDPSFCI